MVALTSWNSFSWLPFLSILRWVCTPSPFRRALWASSCQFSFHRAASVRSCYVRASFILGSSLLLLDSITKFELTCTSSFCLIRSLASVAAHHHQAPRLACSTVHTIAPTFRRSLGVLPASPASNLVAYQSLCLYTNSVRASEHDIQHYRHQRCLPMVDTRTITPLQV